MFWLLPCVAAANFTSPSGQYEGSKAVLGVDITCDMRVRSTVDIVISGPISLECDNESYTFEGTILTLDDVDENGDCVHDQLKKEDVTLKSITYDAPSDVLTLNVKYDHVPVALDLYKIERV